ncbi:MAG: hypothetical protein VKM98_09890 [Cyanobacteriota bacterium]|nr:hypothetical protein [Cyanobacteriota bacterium]
MPALHGLSRVALILSTAGVNPGRGTTGRAQPALIRYVYIDIVDFSKSRSIEAQSEIIESLGLIVNKAVASFVADVERALLLPTGDGMCICLLNLIEPFDLDIAIALSVLEQLHALRAQTVDPTRQFAVRIGLNENQDNIIVDVRGGMNVVGLGINMAQRVMSIAGPSRLFIGQAVYERLCQREVYRYWLKPIRAIVKHGQKLQCYEYFNPTLKCFSARGLAVDASRLQREGQGPTSGTLIQLPLAAKGAVPSSMKKPIPPSFRIGGA